MNRWDLIRMGPFRIFFPLAIVCGLIGVGHWAFFTVGWSHSASGELHALIQAQGFLGCIAVGFLMTFLPRVMGVKEPQHAEVWLAFVCALGIPSGFFMGSRGVMQISFLGMLACLIFFGATRLKSKTKTHPRPLILLDFGLLNAGLGTLLILIGGGVESQSHLILLGRPMVQLGFLLCLAMGMTAFLNPYITGHMDNPQPMFGKTGPHALFGLGILVSFFLNTKYPAAMAWVRFFLVGTHLLLFAKIARIPKKKALYAWMFQTSAWMVFSGLGLAALFPLYRVAALHIVFIGGFSMMIFSFGTLVVLSHSSQAAILNKPLKTFKFITLFLALALIFRLASDIWPNFYFTFIHYASGFWMAAALIWLFFITPKLWHNPLPLEKQ